MERKDTVLVAALKSGDTQALDRFYSEHRKEFIRWSEKVFSLPYDEVVDIYQDAIIIMYENIVSGKLTVLESSLKTYMFGVGKNLILKKFRDNDKSLNLGKELEKITKEEQEEYDEEFIQKQEAAIALIEKLGEPCKSILNLYYYKKLSMKEIAEKLDYKNEDVAKSQKARCLKNLKQSIHVSLKN